MIDLSYARQEFERYLDSFDWENDFVNRIIDRIPYTHPDTKIKMEQLRDMLNAKVSQLEMK